MIGAYQDLNGSRDLTTPPSGQVAEDLYELWSGCPSHHPTNSVRALKKRAD